MHRAAIVVICVLALAGCTTVRSNATYSLGIDFASFQSFAQTPPQKTTPKELPGYSEITGATIEREIAANLTARGLRQVPEDSADLLVAFSVTGEPRTNVMSEGGWGWYGGRPVVTTHYVAGTLVIDFYDAKRKKLVWHGWATADVFDKGGSGDLILEAVTSILSRYPPATGGE